MFQHPDEQAKARTGSWLAFLALLVAAPLVVLTAGWSDLAWAQTQGFLQIIHRHRTVASTITDNGDLNPYAVVVAPVSAGKIAKDDVLITNFNDLSNLQGTGATIIAINPVTRAATKVADLPQNRQQCPGGIGLSTALTMLKSGWIIVGSTPSTDGTTRTKGAGCLMVLDPWGRVAATWTGPDIDDPWGNMAVVDRGTSATLFISMSGFDVPGPQVRDPTTGYPVTVNKATVLRLELSIPTGQPPVITSRTVVANGFAQRADQYDFLIGPTGLALAPDGTLYVADALSNQIDAIPDALTRTTSAGTGRVVTRDGLLKKPLAMCWTPNGTLLVTNAWNGQVVELDPATGKQLFAHWLDTNQAQSPPGNGDLFGIAMKPDGSGFYYVEDDVNALVEATR
jgi:hypothetical protein